MKDITKAKKAYYIEYKELPKKHWYSFKEYEKTFSPCTVLGYRHFSMPLDPHEHLLCLIEVDGKQLEVDYSTIIFQAHEQA